MYVHIQKNRMQHKIMSIYRHLQKYIINGWSIATDIFTLTKTNYICIVDHHTTFLIVRRTEGLAADDLIRSCKIIFLGYGLPKKNDVKFWH